MVIQFICYLFDLLTLILESRVFGFLFYLWFVDEFLEVVNLFEKVSINIFAFTLGHLSDNFPFIIKYLHLLFAKVKLFSCFIDLIFKLLHKSNEVDICTVATLHWITIPLQHLLSDSSHYRLILTRLGIFAKYAAFGCIHLLMHGTYERMVMLNSNETYCEENH